MGRTLTETYGQALEGSLTERLAPVLDIRKLMNGANQYSNIIYDEDFKRRVRILEHDKGNKLTPADKRRIQYTDSSFRRLTRLSRNDCLSE
jgi:hypothetical protein